MGCNIALEISFPHYRIRVAQTS